MKSSRLLPLLAGLAACAFTAGCNILPEAQPDNTRHYVLEGRAPAGERPANAPRVGLRRVEVPTYLRTSGLVVRRGDNEVRFAEDARWAEPLEAGITRVLREQLAARVDVVSYPFPVGVERDFDVVVRVLSADGSDAGTEFSAVIELSRPAAPNAAVIRRTFTAPPAAWDGDYGRLAAGLSAAVAALADEIAGAVASSR